MSDITARIEAIARKLEDPNECEWSDVGEDSLPLVSRFGFWQRWSDLPRKEAVLYGLALLKHHGAAGWLIECLCRAGFDVEWCGGLGGGLIRVSDCRPENEDTAVDVDWCDVNGDPLGVLVELAEIVTGIVEPPEGWCES